MGDNTLTFVINRNKEDGAGMFLACGFSPENTEKIASIFSDGFNWAETKEGYAFWGYVQSRLRSISNIKPVAKSKEPEGEEIKITIDGTEYIARPV